MDTDFAGNASFLATEEGNLNPRLQVTRQHAPLLFSARLASLLFGVLGILATYWAATLIVSSSTALLIAALLAFHPAWLHLSATAANDLPASATAALVLAFGTWILLRVFDRDAEAQTATTSANSISSSGSSTSTSATVTAIAKSPLRPHYLLWGFLFSLALLTKVNTIFLAIAFGASYMAIGIKTDWKQAIRAAIFSIAGCLPLVLAWMGYNSWRGLDATGVERSVPVHRLVTLRAADFADLAGHAPTIWRSIWLDWSRGDVGFAADGLYWGILAIVLIALGGWIFDLVRGAGKGAESRLDEGQISNPSHEASNAESPAHLAQRSKAEHRSRLRWIAFIHLSWILVYTWRSTWP